MMKRSFVSPENFNSEPITQKLQESIKSEKETTWKQMRVEVDKLTDAVGLGVDEKIKETVVAFWAHGFATSASCEGHIKESTGPEFGVEPFFSRRYEHGASAPWVEVYASEPESWQESQGVEREQIERQWTRENLEQQQRMMLLLEEFYQQRETPFDARLTFDSLGAFGGFRIQSFGADLMKLLSPGEQIKKLDLYRKEMDDFTNFLRDKYFLEE